MNLIRVFQAHLQPQRSERPSVDRGLLQLAENVAHGHVSDHDDRPRDGDLLLEVHQATLPLKDPRERGKAQRNLGVAMPLILGRRDKSFAVGVPPRMDMPKYGPAV